MLFALSVLDFRCKDTKFPRQTEHFFSFFSPFNIVTAPTLRIHRRRLPCRRAQGAIVHFHSPFHSHFNNPETQRISVFLFCTNKNRNNPFPCSRLCL